MKRGSKRRLAPTTRVDGVAGKRKRFRSGYGNSLVKTFSRGENFYQKQQQQKQREIALTTRRLFSSPSLVLQQRNMRSRQERAGAVHRLIIPESGVRAHGHLHRSTRPEAHKEQDSCNNNKRNAKSEGGDFTLAGLHSRPST